MFGLLKGWFQNKTAVGYFVHICQVFRGFLEGAYRHFLKMGIKASYF